MNPLSVGGSSGQFIRANGSANAVQGFQAEGELGGNRLTTALPFTQKFQAGDGSSQFSIIVAAANKFWVKVSGTWKEAVTWIKISGVWKQASPNIKISGVWK